MAALLLHRTALLTGRTTLSACRSRQAVSCVCASATTTLVMPGLHLAQDSQAPSSPRANNNIVMFGRATEQPRFQSPQPSGLSRPGQMPGPDSLAEASGLDFIDLHDMDASEAHSRLQDAATYLMLGCGDGVLTPGPSSKGFNLKKLTSFRDNVVRNAAPTVARGCASAARIAKEAKQRKIQAMLAQQRAQCAAAASGGSSSNSNDFQQFNLPAAAVGLCSQPAAAAEAAISSSASAGNSSSAAAALGLRAAVAAPDAASVADAAHSVSTSFDSDEAFSSALSASAGRRHRRGSRSGGVLEGAGRQPAGTAGAASSAWI